MTGAALPAEEGNTRTVGVFLEICELLWGEFALRFAHGEEEMRGMRGASRIVGCWAWSQMREAVARRALSARLLRHSRAISPDRDISPCP